MTQSWRHVLCIKNSIDIDCNYFMQFRYFRSVSIGTVCGEGKELLCLRLVGTYQGLWLLKNSLSLRFLNWGTRIFPKFNIFCHMPCHALQCLAIPRLAFACSTLPDPTSMCLASPRYALPCTSLPYFALPSLL